MATWRERSEVKWDVRYMLGSRRRSDLPLSAVIFSQTNGDSDWRNSKWSCVSVNAFRGVCVYGRVVSFLFFLCVSEVDIFSLP